MIDDEESCQPRGVMSQRNTDVDKTITSYKIRRGGIQNLSQSQQETIMSNVRRRPLIVEKTTHGKVSESAVVTALATSAPEVTPSSAQSSVTSGATVTVSSPMEQDETSTMQPSAASSL